MNKFLKFLKDNILYLVAICLTLGAIAFFVVSIFVPIYHIDYYGLLTETNTIIRSDDIGLLYAIQNFGEWFKNGRGVEYHMFIQYCFIIFVILGLSLLSAVTSFILGFFKEKLSKKIEFVGGVFGIVTAIGGFTTVFLMVLSFSVNKLSSNDTFSFSSCKTGALAGFYLIIVTGILFIFIGALLAALSSEKNTD